MHHSAWLPYGKTKGFLPSLAIARPSSIVDCMLVWGGCCHCVPSAQEAWSTGVVQTTLYTIGCFPSLPGKQGTHRQPVWIFPCRRCVKPPNSAPGGKASLEIGSRESGSEAGRNVLLLSRPCSRANSNRRQNGLGVPSLISPLSGSWAKGFTRGPPCCYKQS